MKKRMVLRGARFNDPGDEQKATPPVESPVSAPEAGEMPPPAEESAGTEQGI